MKSAAIVDFPGALDRYAAQANEAHTAAQSAARSAAESAKRAGEALKAAKKHVRAEGGRWLPWLAANCPTISERTAQRYMDLAERWSTLDPTRVADLSLRGALAFLTSGRPAKARTIALPGQLALFQELPVAERRLPAVPREETLEYQSLINRAAKVFGTGANRAEAIYAALNTHPALRVDLQ